MAHADKPIGVRLPPLSENADSGAAADQSTARFLATRGHHGEWVYTVLAGRECALERLGVTLEHIVQPIADALRAPKSYVNQDGLMIESHVPDHKIRLEASRDAVALLGGIPKVGEGTPTAYGLNLFIAVDHGPRREEPPLPLPR